MTLFLLVAAGVALWFIVTTLPGLLKDLFEEPPRLHSYTTRKLEERQYRFFDDDQWTPWEP